MSFEPLATIGRIALAIETKARGVAMRFGGYGGSDSGGYGGGMPYLNVKVPGSKFDYASSAGDLWRNTVVAIGLLWIKRNFPEPRPVVVTDHGGKEKEIEGHAAAELIKDPNPYYDGDALWGGIALSYFVSGDAYLLKGQTVDGVTRQLYYVPHWQMYPRWPEDGSQFISHYDYVVDGRVIPLRTDQVIHFRNGIDPHNYRHGLAELAIAVREICTDNEAATYCATILRNMGIVGFVISPESEDDTIEKDDREEMKALWRREFTAENRGGLMVNSVRLKIDQVGNSPEQMTLDKIRQMPEARICAALNLRPTLLGLSVGDHQRSYKNSIEDRRAAYEDCLIPLQKSLAKQFTRQCPELFRRGQRLGWDYSGVQAMREDETEKVKRAVVGYQGGLLRKNEGREAIGLPTVPGGNAFYGEDEQGNPKLPMAGDVPTLGAGKMGSEE